MKIKLSVPALLVFVLLASCSTNDDDYGSPTPIETATDYLPTTVGNQWDYENSLDIPDQIHQENNERLSVVDSTTENATPSYLFSSDAAGIEKGVMTGLFTNGKLNKVEGSIIFNGSFSFYLPVIDQTLSLPVHNLFILDQNEESGQVMSTITDTLTKTLSFSGQSLPTTFKYTIETSANDSFESYPANGQTYEDVISSDLNISLSARVELPVGFNIEILTPQQVLQSTNYFAKDVGMIYSTNSITMEFEDLSEYNVPQIDPVDGTSTQTLSSYQVQ